nr:penicillin-binding protein [Paracoccaceae bacterium]
DPVTAYQLVSMMEGVTVRGTASSLGASLDFAVGGKTGTTNDAKDAWFIGFSPDLVVGCFVGFDNPRTLGKRMSGGKLCAPVFQNFMAEAMKDRPKFEFRRPPGAVLKKIDSKSGACVSDSAQGKQYIWEAFRQTDNPCAIASIGGFELRTIPTNSATDAATPGQAPQSGAPQRPQPPSGNSLKSGIW